MPKSVWDYLNREFSPGVSWANKAADVGGTMVKSILDSAINSVKTPGNLMKPNPYPPGSEEASWYDDQKTKAATDFGGEMALNTMGTGAVVGVPVKGAEQVLGAGILRPKKATGGYHGTTIPFDEFSTATTHFSRDPNVARQFTLGHPNDVLYTEGSRTIPVVGDIQSPLVLNHPAARDVRDWNDSFGLLSAFDAMDYSYGGKFLPEGLMKDINKIPEDDNWIKGLTETLKDRGYDSVRYPHSGSRLSTPDAFMTLNPGQVVPRFSPEGQELIKARGILEPKKDLKWDEKWRDRWENPGKEHWSPRYNPYRPTPDAEWEGKFGINHQNPVEGPPTLYGYPIDSTPKPNIGLIQVPREGIVGLKPGSYSEDDLKKAIEHNKKIARGER